ncbi:LOW QUALITY PROTEIN: dual specificity protein phosphatase Mpk3-like [Pectinophora gossypiella]|uniref:LOW QUALITY PROTEIN: dual specificity protein phosphatase Mpk3-like n=1 Tax=Pectinophora gossypiella TaxID=13191 RepID=UPI00214EB543|nr:LOW QUALITY PROTEIN: dual specificity protein phosphatase Mpk3-like [Pectinophora gossypiella]
MPTDSECECDLVSKEWLLSKLRSDERDTILIDCRGSNDYAVSHIRSAVNFSIPSIMLRRLAAGKIELASTVQCKELKARIAHCRAQGTFVLYGDDARPDPDSVHGILLKRLKQDGVHVVCLEGDFAEFHRSYPEWCSEAGAQHVSHLPLMGLRSLRISGSGCEDALSSGSSSECEDAGPHQQDFPVEILPNLYLGNSTNSEDCDALARHNIKYVLNVTPDLPNTFEAAGGVNYLKIPIADHWSQNLAVHFPQAIRFIEEAMSARCGVLVHCVAGVSRSVTVTLAYLMQRHRLCLRDAFELVRSRKTDIAPNFHFMRQLHSFERDLGLHEHSASLSKVLAALGGELRAPDSGVSSVGSAGGGGGGAGPGGRAAGAGRRVARLGHRVRPLERGPRHAAMTVLHRAQRAPRLSAPRPSGPRSVGLSENTYS